MTHSLDLTMTFENSKTFQACRDAEEWCAALGLSVGRMQAHAPRGLLWGDFDIAKWRNLNAKERAALDGRMTGDFRNGPVFVQARQKKSPAA